MTDCRDSRGSSGGDVAGDRPDVLSTGLVEKLLPAQAPRPVDGSSQSLLGLPDRGLAGPARPLPDVYDTSESGVNDEKQRDEGRRVVVVT